MTYGDEVREAILYQLEMGRTLREVCRMEGMPDPAAVLKWSKVDPDGFGQQYAQARRIGYEIRADEILELCDEYDGKPDRDEVAKRRLQIDTRKWLLSKCLPKIYGDKIEINDVSENKPAVIIGGMTDQQWAARFGPMPTPEGHGD